MICRNAAGFGPRKETLLSNIPMYRLDSGQETIPYSRIALSSAFLFDATDKSMIPIEASNSNIEDRCCLRLSQLTLTNRLFRRYHLIQYPYNRYENLRDQLAETMKLDLSPTYGDKYCQNSAEKSGVSEGRRRCFTLADLHPKHEFAMAVKDIRPSLQICAVVCSMSFALLVLELCRPCGWRVSQRCY